MIHTTVIGAGVHGARMAKKYADRTDVRLRAIASPRPTVDLGVPQVTSARAWRKAFGTPGSSDLFDLCVHQDMLLPVLKEWVSIGARNFILPKPIALQQDTLQAVSDLCERHKLKVVVASQWHYARVVHELRDFIAAHRATIARAEIIFSRPVEQARLARYSALTMFLPHMLQIAEDTKLLAPRATPRVERTLHDNLRVDYGGKIKVQLTSDLAATIPTEHIRLYAHNKQKAVVVANLAGKRDKRGFYTSITIRGKTRRIYEDALDSMLSPTLAYFRGKKSREVLTLKKYLPVARATIAVAEAAHRSVVVLGGGIFGTLAALEIAKQGLPVTLLEKERDILLGASLVNQCRVHMGYHYPRDPYTARHSLRAQGSFEKTFSSAIVKRLDNYYLVAKDGSLTTPEAYAAFCKKIGLPYRQEWPKGTAIAKDRIALSLRVPEVSFDAHTVRRILRERIRRTPNLTVLVNSPATDLARQRRGFRITYGAGRVAQCGAVVNATYSGITAINRLAGLPQTDYQYELCEMPVAHTPWRNTKTGWSIIDGPFFGAMPFGFSRDYLLYDVELSVLERYVGSEPRFKHSVAYYDTPARRAKRFARYKKKWSSYTPDVRRCRAAYSLYVVRAVLPKKEKTDARPTIMKRHLPGFWEIFSGKITTSVPISLELARQIKRHFSVT